MEFGIDWLSYGEFFVGRYAAIATRGIIILGGMFAVFWLLKRPWMDKYRVPTVGRAQAKPKREALFTFTTYIVYAVSATTVAILGKEFGISKMYTDPAQYGMAYTVLSFFIFLFWVDTSFYWSHYVMHKSKMVYKVHATHHQFVNVTPWCAYAFHTGEAIINAGAFFLLLMLVPWHPLTMFAFVLFSIFYNGLIHLGYDLYPKSWRTNPVMKWWNTTTHHIYHHQKSNCNYGFIFTFWDKLMKTERLPQ